MSTHNIPLFSRRLKRHLHLPPDLGPVVQSIATLTSLLMTNLLNVVAKVVLNTTDIFAAKM